MAFEPEADKAVGIALLRPNEAEVCGQEAAQGIGQAGAA